MSLENFGEEQIYNFERIGSFGRFYSGASFPIEYIMTTFSAAELSELSFARDIHPEKIDFELLMQRDIDEERIRLEMEPYLNPDMNKLTATEIRARSVFFPPLLAAIVPSKGKTMDAYYTDEQIIPDDDKHIIREWKGLFQLTYFISNNPHAYKLSETISVQSEPVKLEIRIAKGNEYGGKLVVIDGQHRLFTLKKVYANYPELLENMGVPVCILFAPNATAKKNQESAPYRIPTVPEVFRHLFVDVNNTAKQVGGHFNILLSDDTIASIACRKFCDFILNKRSIEGLAVIEWNSKSKKDCTKIARSYSLSNIGIINKALDDSFSNRKLLTKYLLNLDSVKDELYPNGEDDDEIMLDYPLVQWNKFSITQKNILDNQVDKYLIPCLEKIFFESNEFKTALDIFNKALMKLKKLAASEQAEAIEARQVLNQILDYMPINEGKSFESARLVYRNFESDIKLKKEKQVSTILQYALFQRAIIEAWAQLLDIARTYVANPLDVTQGFIKLLDIALAEKGKFFSFDQLYMQNTVFIGSQIIVRQDTRKILTQLLMTHLMTPFNCQQIAAEMDVADDKFAKLVQKLLKKGQTIVKEFPKFYEMARKRIFKANYRVYISISGEERAALAQAEAEQKYNLQEVKEKKRAKKDVSDHFDILIHEHIKTDIELANLALKNTLEANDTINLAPQIKESMTVYQVKYK
ncbi:DNA sulfur modification protein DndB [Candidatus Marithrix sp. Canyon 246]|uniref:DNA sulfur modification protein DndB n=1 Tax=Candidatus Marithrix sp. Canyon 246 TaxID=1827136 RepID=UPI000849F722|nr:DNA sulfur modification protein DndB [Candidatus Marithrix sp. Canyon 246]